MKYYLGIDNGGTTTKAALYDTNGKELAIASVETELIVERPGYAERDLNAMWDANISVIREVIKKAGISSVDIAGIACCGHGKGLYLWGKDGKPARNGILSNDRRAAEYLARWNSDGTAEKVREMTLQSLMVMQPAPLLAWLKDNEPETAKNIKHILSCKDYVKFRLTGNAYAEMSDISGTNLLNLKTGKYDDRIFELFGITYTKDALSMLCVSTDNCGGVSAEAAKATGLIEGTPVFGGMFDIDACALAVGAVTADKICMIAGTWSINEYVSKNPIVNGSIAMNSFFCTGNEFLIEESSPTSAGNNEWFMKKVLTSYYQDSMKAGLKAYKVADQAVEALGPKEYCPIFLPFVMGSNMHPDATGAFVGLSQFHDRAHLIKSVYEGVVFCHRYHLEKLLSSHVGPVNAIRLAGGAARSKVWVQMFADILDYPIEVVDVNETGALGCAISVAVSLGDYKDYSEAIEKMVTVSRRVKPNASMKQYYSKRYALYVKTSESLNSVWAGLRENADVG